MAYSLKSVKFKVSHNCRTRVLYCCKIHFTHFETIHHIIPKINIIQGQQTKILLQNENGPCPLIACANALLLSSKISLPESSIRNNVASIDDVVNMLASHALKQNPQRIHNVVTSASTSASMSTTSRITTAVDKSSQEGEITNNNDVDDDTKDRVRAHYINELLILFPTLQHGMDVNPQFTLGPTGCEYTIGVSAFDFMGVDLVHGWLVDVEQDGDLAAIIGRKTYNELIDLIVKSQEAGLISDQLTEKIAQLNKGKEEKEEEDGDGEGDAQTIYSSTSSVNSFLFKNENEKELHKLHDELQIQNDIAARGSVVQQFLDESSHQLTYAGLTKLHSHVKEGHLCVFFRNNHFATLTKHEGILYLLVTDLGYSGVNEVVWEKLDDISGDTDLYDESFRKSMVQSIDPVTSGPNLTPEQLLAHRGQTENDYQLALELSRNDHINTNRLALEEGQLIAAATQLSLQTYNESTGQGSTPVNETKNNNNNNNDDDASERLAYEMQKKINEEKDREMAMRLQAELNQRATSHQRTNLSDRHRAGQQMQRSQAARQSESSGCSIS